MEQRPTLSPDRIAQLKTDQRTLHDTLPEFDKLDECGVDCQNAKADVKEAARRVDAMLRHYGQ